MKNTISIVIPAWNGRELLEKNLPSLLQAMKNKKNRIAEIIIVDDKSTDDTVTFLKSLNVNALKIVCHKVNRGFSATVNTGFRSSSSPIVCLLNQDVSVEKDFLESVHSHFKDEKVFGVSLHEKGYGYAKGIFVDGFIAHKPGVESRTPTRSFWVSGGSGVFNRNLWMEIGGLDEKILIPFYWEDVDISYRAQKRGYKIIWDPSARVIHQHEAVINKNNFKLWWLNLIKERSYLLFNWKNITSHNLRKRHIRGLLKRVRKHPGYLKVVLLASLKLREVIKALKKEKKESVVSDEAIFASFE